MISIIAAMTKKRIIGNQGKLPWNMPEEMRLFTNITSGKTVIMGRRTFESIGILKGRKNIVITKTLSRMKEADVCMNLDEGVDRARSHGREIFVIGGAEIFAQAISFADRMYLSYIKKDYPGDALFPEFDKAEWIVYEKKNYKEFERVVYIRK